MSEPRVLREASFDPKLKSYWIWQPVLWLTVFLVTIPIAILYALIARLLIGRYIARLSCALTERTLDIKKGMLNRTESTIPLEKITDLQLFQGPVMRFFGLHGFKVETAGQTGASGGALVNMIGIVETPEFRKAVLAQRDRLHDRALSSGEARPPSSEPSTMEEGEATRLLAEIRDTLHRIEEQIGDATR